MTRFEALIHLIITYGGGLLIVLWFILITLASTRTLLGWP